MSTNLRTEINMQALEMSDVIDAALRNDGTGYCIVCGWEHHGVEYQESESPCDSCGNPAVYGAEEILFQLGV